MSGRAWLKTPGLREKLQDLYWTQGLTTKEIGTIMGKTAQNIQHHFRQLGIPLRSYSEALTLSHAKGKRKGINTRPKGSWDPERERNIVTMRTSGASLSQIGSQFGLSRQRIHQILKRGT